MSRPLADRVASTSARWNWYPSDARVVETPDYLLVRFPDWFHSPLELLRCTPTRPTTEVIDEVLAQARGLDADVLSVWVKLDAPDDLEPLLRARGSEVAETLDVLAAPLAATGVATGVGTDAAALPPGVALVWVEELATLRAFEEISAAVFGGTVPSTARLVQSLAEIETEGDPGTGRVLGLLDGRPAAVGGLSIADGAARLWGGAVLPESRHRGLYRAVLAARMRRGAEVGCDLALVKGRVETSGPILRRAGFATYGQERLHRIRLD